MLNTVKWVFWIAVLTLTLAFLHYTLPRWDVVRITDTYETRVSFGTNSMFWTHARTGNAVTDTEGRDVFFIQAIRPNGRPIVYRNQDTGWGWPPLFKFDTTNLQARAADLRSTSEAPKWVAIKHYGWRSELFTIFPNALSVKPVEGPDARVIPWGSIAALIGLAALVRAIWVRLRRLWTRRIDPLLDGLD